MKIEIFGKSDLHAYTKRTSGHRHRQSQSHSHRHTWTEKPFKELSERFYLLDGQLMEDLGNILREATIEDVEKHFKYLIDKLKQNDL